MQDHELLFLKLEINKTNLSKLNNNKKIRNILKHAFLTLAGSEFQVRAAATENARSPIVERRIDGTSTVEVSADRECRVAWLETGRVVSVRWC